MEKKIKLLHVTSSLKIGGAEVVLCDIIRNLGRDEFEHHVIYFHDGPNVARVKNIGAKVYNIRGLFCLYDPLFFIRLFFLIKKINPNIIHSLLWSANVSSRPIARILNIPHVSVYHNGLSLYSAFKNFLDMRTRHLSDKLIAVSDDIGAQLQKTVKYKLKNKTAASQIQVIPNGIDVAVLHKMAEKSNITRGDIGIENTDFVIGAVGRLSSEKNFSLLLKSFALVATHKENARLVIVGVGPLENHLKELANKLGVKDKVSFIIGKNALDYYLIFDCFVQSSIKEGLSIALLEAMSFGLACIVTDKINNHPVVIDKKNGLIIDVDPIDSIDALYKGLLTVIEDNIFAKNLGKNAKECVLSDFSAGKMVEEYKTIFCSISNRNLTRWG